MSFPRYPKYKDSGVEWLGAVPEHWDVVRLKNVLQQRITDGPHTTPVFMDEGVPFLSVDGIQDGELQFDGCRYVSEADHAEYRKKALPQKDDLLLGKAASTGKIARVKVDFEFSIWSPLALIRLDPTVSNAIFFEQSLKSPIAQAQIDNFCTANTQKNISMDDIPRLILTNPPLTEQIQIAAFLDRETAKIDGLVGEQRRLMELLKEKRQAVISHAVTQGLNPHAPMKPSGIEWLGDVPAHWDICPLKRAFRSVDYGISDSLDSEGAVAILRMGNIENGKIVIDDLKYTDAVDTYLLLQAGDLLYNRTNSLDLIGKVGMFLGNNESPISFASYLVRLRTVEESLPDYFAYLLNTERILGLARASAFVAIGQCNLNPTRYGQITIVIPPRDEQATIVKYLNAETGNFDTLITEAQRAVDLLQERRTALISAAVTGQIDVRPFAEKQAA